jgi:tryptophan synthase alpha chain
MSRIAQAFEKAAAEGRAALIIYVTAGDPDLDTSARILEAAAEAGADLIEVGVPFSDPTADGVVIQRASERALRAGTRVSKVLEIVAQVRAHSQVPMLLFGYYNPFLAYGEARLMDAAKRAGADGFLVVDLPCEEAGAFAGMAQDAGLDFVPLVAPTTTPERLERIAGQASAFLYYVSMTGVTGASTDLAAAAKRARAIGDATRKPVALGFGIKTPADVRQVASEVDAVVVGSAVVQRVEQATDAGSAVAAVRALVASLRQATERNPV